MILLYRIAAIDPSSRRLKSTVYSCKRRHGALLTLPFDGLEEDVIRTKVFEDYIRDHVDSWFNFARRHNLDVDRMEDLILVTGCTLVTSWGVAAFVDNTLEAELSLRTNTANGDRASFDWRVIRPNVSYRNSYPGSVRSLRHIVTSLLILQSVGREMYSRINAYSSEVFEQSASSYGLDLKVQQNPLPTIQTIIERMRYR